MPTDRLPILIDLNDVALEVRYPCDDIRGRTVFDRTGNEIGNVDGLIIDEDDRQVRWLRIGFGGLLGFGKTKRLLPVEAITRIDDIGVHIDLSQERVGERTPYDPLLTESFSFGEVNGHYGSLPFWATGAPARRARG